MRIVNKSQERREIKSTPQIIRIDDDECVDVMKSKQAITGKMQANMFNIIIYLSGFTGEKNVAKKQQFFDRIRTKS